MHPMAAIGRILDDQIAGFGRELHGGEMWFQFREYHPCRCERGVAAQGDFHGRRKPAQIVSAFTAPDKKCCFRQIVLPRNRLHMIVIEPVIQRHDCGRIALEHAVCKRVHLPLLQFHRVGAPTAD
jgi:hypothetical protein